MPVGAGGLPPLGDPVKGNRLTPGLRPPLTGPPAGGCLVYKGARQAGPAKIDYGGVDMPSDKTLISVRLSAEALAALDTWPGENRTDRLEALIMRASLERRALEDQLDDLRRQIAEAWVQYYEIHHLMDKKAEIGDLLEKILADLTRMCPSGVDTDPPELVI